MRFEECSEEVFKVMNEVIEKHFPELISCIIHPIFDLKKRIKGGNIVLASIQKPNEMLRFFTIDDSDTGEGYNYVIRIDKNAWDNIEEIDKKRLIRHELNHTLVDFDASDPYKIIPHDIEDFVVEIERNKDDVDWAKRVGAVALSKYEED